jgi:hypothetical protein
MAAAWDVYLLYALPEIPLVRYMTCALSYYWVSYQHKYCKHRNDVHVLVYSRFLTNSDCIPWTIGRTRHCLKIRTDNSRAVTLLNIICQRQKQGKGRIRHTKSELLAVCDVEGGDDDKDRPEKAGAGSIS